MDLSKRKIFQSQKKKLSFLLKQEQIKRKKKFN